MTAPGEEADKAADSKVYDMQEFVVTESKLPQNQENVTQRIEVINQQQIDRTPLGMGNLSELFRYQPGTFVSVLSRNDANWGSYGGLGPKYSGYLLDGISDGDAGEFCAAYGKASGYRFWAHDNATIRADQDSDARVIMMTGA